MSDARRLALEVDDLRRKVRHLETATRIGASSIEDGFAEVYDEDGTLRQIIGAQADGTFTAIDLNGAPPPIPADPSLSNLPGLLVVTSYGLTADGSDWPLDFARIEVHVSATSGFTPSAATKVADFTRDGGSITVAVDAGTYYVVLLAVNTSGISSAPTAEQSIAVSPPATGSGGVATYHSDTEPLGLTAADDGALWYETDNGNLPHRWSGDLLAWVAMPLGGSALTADAIDGKTITGSTLQTATEGRRIVITSGADSGQIEMFTASPNQDQTNPGGLWSDDHLIGSTEEMLLLVRGPVFATDPGLNNAIMQLVVDRDTTTETYTTTARLQADIIDLNIPTLGGEVKINGDATINGQIVVNTGMRIGGSEQRLFKGLDYGQTAGTTDSSGRVKVNHSLGVTPVAVLVFPSAGTSRYNYGEVQGLRDASSFLVDLENSDGSIAANVNVNFSWVAIR